MNRDRQLVGVNSYAKELGFDPLDWLLRRGPGQAWLDFCCAWSGAVMRSVTVPDRA